MNTAATTYKLFHSLMRKKKQRQRRWWQTQLGNSKSVYGDHHLNPLANGLYRNFTRMPPTNFSLEYFDQIKNNLFTPFHLLRCWKGLPRLDPQRCCATIYNEPVIVLKAFQYKKAFFINLISYTH